MERIDRETDRVRSLEMGKVTGLFDDGAFPMTTEEIIEEFGDIEIQYPRRSESIEAILTTSGLETYRTADEVELAVLNGVSRDAVGRPRYSDRGDSPHDTDEFARRQQSF